MTTHNYYFQEEVALGSLDDGLRVAMSRPNPRPTPSTPAAASIRAERRRLAEEERISALLDAYGDDDPGDDGAIIAFTKEGRIVGASPDAEPTILRYVFIRSSGVYFGTGTTTPQGASWTQLVDFLIGLGIEPSSVSFCQQGGGDEWSTTTPDVPVIETGERFIPLEAAL